MLTKKVLVNNSDFKCFLKIGREPLSHCWASNEFHTDGAVTEKGREDVQVLSGSSIKFLSFATWFWCFEG